MTSRASAVVHVVAPQPLVLQVVDHLDIGGSELREGGGDGVCQREQVASDGEILVHPIDATGFVHQSEQNPIR